MLDAMDGDKAKVGNIEPLADDNYITWSFRIKRRLAGKGLEACISGQLNPENPDSVKNDAKALSIICDCIRDQHIATIATCNTAKEAWDALQSVYQTHSNARRQQLRLQLLSIKKNGGETVSNYFSRVKLLWLDIKNTGLDIAESEVVFIALGGLPKEYNMIVTIIRASDLTLTLDGTLAKLLTNLTMEHDQDDAKDVTAFYSQGRGGKRGGGQGGWHKSGRGGSWNNRNNQSSQGGNSTQITCAYCHRPGHIEKECRTKVRDETGGRNSNNNNRSKNRPPTAFTAFCNTAHHNTAPTDFSEWTIDSGATRHLTPHRHLLQNATPLDGSIRVKYGNSEEGTAESEGDIFFSAGGDSIVIKALYVPGLATNLFSVSTATAAGGVFTLLNKSARLTRNGRLFIEAANNDGLFTFTAQYSHDTAKALAASTAAATSPDSVDTVKNTIV